MFPLFLDHILFFETKQYYKYSEIFHKEIYDRAKDTYSVMKQGNDINGSYQVGYNSSYSVSDAGT